ncbi:MAG: RNA polymerase factor sigma-54, partial [Planctomycetota bacterium]
ARPISLQEFLFRQFNLLDVSPLEREIGKTIIFNIDRKGYLRFPLEEIYGFENGGPSRAEVDRVLSLVQGLEPAGVGGRDLVEVLLLQLDPNDPNLMSKERLIRNHLDDLMKNRLPRVSKALGLSMEELKHLMGLIGLLNPLPGTLYDDDETRYIAPDVIVELIDGDYVIRIENSYVPSLRISRMYRKMLRDKSNDPETLAFVKQKMGAARWLIEAIVQRQNTLHRVVSEIFKVQRSFLDRGLTHLSPLKMQRIADELEIHVSTVSRAISQKYVQTHRGIYPLKYFFTGGTTSAMGKDLSRATVKMRVGEIVGEEDRSKPLSDEEIGKALQREGLKVARRTVTKYRKMLDIPSSRRRKVY